ncbi:MAG: hypothetical protein KJP18_15675 [Gemmatimonadetes bacterium]|nr:hypothetical protein [Gemmatimonadota bacterium]NNK62644.1 hypothetical protein [Gemmatimonadota bacterium]
MELHTMVQIFAVIHLTTVGLSHIAAHRAWAEFFVLLREKGEAGVFVVAFLSLGFGSVVAAFHPVWSGLPLVLTLFGWTQVLKGLLYLCVPSYGLKKLGLVTLERSRMFIAPGVFMLALAGLVIWSWSS